APKWMGKCPSCGEWNTFTEEVVKKPTQLEQRESEWKMGKVKAYPIAIGDVQSGNTTRRDTKNQEFNRVLGGGIVPGSVILLGGQPGIGKSTLLLQIALTFGGKILYVSGEESEEQIKLRADRLAFKNDACFLYTETNISEILAQTGKLQPDLLIIDSIQTVVSSYIDSPAGSISQVKECTGELQRFAKETGIPIIIIGHITKEGSIAGPKLLEHIVDVVVQFEGDSKNRFGSTDELGIYQMSSNGLEEVPNPSERLMENHQDEISGTAIAAVVEGQRPIYIETQALVTNCVFGTPQRSANGYDYKRMSMILAVLEKRCKLPFGSKDVYLNIVGGLKIVDPGIDLAIVAALISSLQDISIGRKIAFAAEIGLTGEIRSVPRIEQRILEADRLGFEDMYVAASSKLGNIKTGVRIHKLSRLEELFERIFG
ncbi:MAG TPA: DNA repair protein RadA, partial [Saprospiraceae bacterium]|nr:DNA repair protein RadA [Saprospiraceae bacterium]